MKATKKRKPNRNTITTSIALTQAQRDQLKAIQVKTGVSVSVTVRRLLDRHLPEAAGTAATRG